MEGAAAVALVAAIAFGSSAVTLLDAGILCALLLGFFSALGVAMAPASHGSLQTAEEAAALLLAGATMFDRLTDETKQELRQYFPEPRETVRVRDTDVHPSVLVGIAILQAGSRRPAEISVETEVGEVLGPRRIDLLH